MTIEFLAYVGYALALGLLAVAFVYQRKSADYLLLFQDSSQRLKDALQSARNQQQEIDQLTSQADGLDKLKALQQETIEKQQATHQRNCEALENTVSALRQEAERSTRQMEHLEEQVQAFKRQLIESQSSEKSLRAVAAQAGVEKVKKTEEYAKQLGKDLLEKKKQVENLTHDVQIAKKEKAKIEQILRKINPQEIGKNKVKVRRMEQLLVNMKGLREMAEERNQNWEVALLRLSNYVLGKDPETKLADQTAIGSIVGAALEKIGSAIIHPDEDFVEEFLQTPTKTKTKTKPPATKVLEVPEQESSNPTAMS